MYERSVSKNSVLAVISDDQIITEYPDDTRYPSYLMLGFVEGRALHVTVASDSEATVIIKGVPAEICENCGEDYLSEDITDEVLQRAESAVQSGVEVEIVRFAA